MAIGIAVVTWVPQFVKASLSVIHPCSGNSGPVSWCGMMRDAINKGPSFPQKITFFGEPEINMLFGTEVFVLFAALIRLFFGHVVGLSAAEVHRQSLEALNSCNANSIHTSNDQKECSLLGDCHTLDDKKRLETKKGIGGFPIFQANSFGRIPNLAIPFWLYLVYSIPS